MPVTKKRKPKVPNDKAAASLAAFLERPLPDADEVSRFEDAVEKEARNDEVEENLSAIYHDKEGRLVDVSKVDKKKRLRIIVLFKQVFVLTIVACGLYGAFYYYFQRPTGADGINVSIEAPEKVIAGETINYNLNYQNDSGLALSDVKIEAILPSGFVLMSSSPEPSGVNSWQIGDLPRDASGTVTVTGYLVAPVDSPNIITSRLTYTPENFSSGFKKEATANTVISGLGFGVNVEYLNTALLAQNNEFKVLLSGFSSNLLSEFYLDISGSDNITVEKVSVDSPKPTEGEVATSTKIEASGEGRWLLSGLAADSEERVEIPVTFKLKEKVSDNEDLRLRFFKKEADGSERIFWEKTITFEVMKSDLNLSLSLNGAKTDQPLDFGETLEYTISYSNNGDSTLYDLVLMGVINGDAVQWSSLRDPNNGSLTGSAIVWTKEDINALAEVAPGAKGEFDFSVKLKEFSMNAMAKEQEIISFAQYGINNSQAGSEDNKSNTIKSLLNSDLSLDERILYFNEDNLPVGSGPLPPRVGEQTAVRVYWTIKNNLHDLQETETIMTLPVGVEWIGSNHTNVGSISYNAENRQVSWKLGYLPTSVYRADAEFSIGITPNDSDRNKILVLSSGSTVQAVDAITKDTLTRRTGAKTTKLEDDEIAGLSNNGRVE